MSPSPTSIVSGLGRVDGRGQSSLIGVCLGHRRSYDENQGSGEDFKAGGE